MAYYSQYIAIFEEENKDINIGGQECTISNLIEAFDRLGINESYYSFNNVEKEHSICLQEIGKDKSQVKFIGSGNKIVLKTLEMENWDTYDTMFMHVYLLFLLDSYCQLLLKNKEIDIPFSDEEYKIFLALFQRLVTKKTILIVVH